MDGRDYPFPNYAALLPEPGHYVFKNIERRQRLRDQRENLMRKNNGELDEDGSNIDDKNEGSQSVRPEKKADKAKAAPRLFDTRFLESVRLRHHNISNDDNKSFKLSSTSEAGDHIKPTALLHADGYQNLPDILVNQSLLSINQYSSSARHLKKN